MDRESFFEVINPAIKARKIADPEDVANAFDVVKLLVLHEGNRCKDARQSLKWYDVHNELAKMQKELAANNYYGEKLE